MQITKTDYLEYSFCRKNLWLKKYKPELFEDFELSDFEKKIIEEGNAADEAARKLFPDGVLVSTHGSTAIEDTNLLIADKARVIFQGTFVFENFFIRADVLVWDNRLNGWELYEVKATNEVKKTGVGNHVRDLAFQKQVIQKCGARVVKTGVIHLNSEYRKHGELDYDQLFITEDISNEIRDVEVEVLGEMEEMKIWLAMDEQSGCDCVYKGRSAHCSSFAYSNPVVPEYSIHDLYRIGNSKKKLMNWVDEGRFTLEEVIEEKLNDRQQLQISSYIQKRPFVDGLAIREMFNELQFPLYFLDYEGFIAAIPLFDGFGPYEHVPFQYSLHILHEDGSVEHTEFLITEKQSEVTKPLVEQLVADMSEKGTAVSWHAAYEKKQNRKLAQLHPEHVRFFEEMNETMFDLETIFTNNLYVDPDFKGKSSIKNILPVLIPSLTYKELNIRKGDQASERWERMMTKSIDEEEKQQIAQDLLAYCKMDTWAMVEIYQFLKKL